MPSCIIALFIMASSQVIEDFKAKSEAAGVLPAPKPSEVKATTENDSEMLSGLWGATGRSRDHGRTPRIIPIEEYKHGEDDWEEWSENFEMALEKMLRIGAQSGVRRMRAIPRMRREIPKRRSDLEESDLASAVMALSVALEKLSHQLKHK